MALFVSGRRSAQCSRARARNVLHFPSVTQLTGSTSLRIVVTQLEALYQTRQFPAAHTERHGGLALVPMSQRQCVHEVPSHGSLECLEIVSHVNWIHSTDSLLLPP